MSSKCPPGRSCRASRAEGFAVIADVLEDVKHQEQVVVAGAGELAIKASTWIRDRQRGSLTRLASSPTLYGPEPFESLERKGRPHIRRRGSGRKRHDDATARSNRGGTPPVTATTNGDPRAFDNIERSPLARVRACLGRVQSLPTMAMRMLANPSFRSNPSELARTTRGVRPLPSLITLVRGPAGVRNRDVERGESASCRLSDDPPLSRKSGIKYARIAFMRTTVHARGLNGSRLSA